MKSSKLFFCVSIGLIFCGCFLIKAPTSTNHTECFRLCENLLGENLILTIPLRKVDKNLLAVPFSKTANEELVTDSFRVLTRFEAQNVTKSLFCLIGSNEKKLDGFFQSLDSEKLSLSAQGKFLKVYFYNMGDYFRNGQMVYPLEKTNGENVEFYITQLAKFDLMFTVIKGELIYTGNSQDSLNLLDYNRTKFKK